MKEKGTTPEAGGPATGPSRLLGVYPQKRGGLFMQRIKILGGRLNWYQWRRIAEVATAYCAGCALHVTTRQDIELHNITREDIVMVQQALAEAALTTFGACGDSVRNMTVCSGCDLCEDGFDLMPMAQLVRQCLEQQAVIFNLPRKFKISFSGCLKACARPWLNDLGFIADRDGGFTVVGAGSLGPKPALGIELYRDMPAGEVPALCLAAMEFFEQHGDRLNRRRARLRHGREKLGDDAFKAELGSRLERVKARESWPRISVMPVRSDLKLQCRLQLPDGNISPMQVLCLADAAEASGAAVRIDLEHGLVLYGPEPVPLPKDMAILAAAPRIVACPGCTTCPRGLVNCRATARKIREAFSARDLNNIRIHISGCPNNCAHSAAAHIGLVGMIRAGGGQSTPHYRLLNGGGNGTNDVLAQPCGIARAEDVPGAIEALLKEAQATE